MVNMDLTDELVLVVDDDTKDSQKNIEEELKNIGFNEIVLCNDGSDALNYINDNSLPLPYLIISDCQMPVSGLEWLTMAQHRLKDRTDGNYPRIVVLSNNPSISSDVREKLTKIYGYATKIYSCDKLDFIIGMKKFLEYVNII